MITSLPALLRRFAADRSGLASVEYLALLGVLTAVVIVSVIVFGAQLPILWTAWADWLSDVVMNMRR